MFPPFPDFLARQISDIKKKKEIWENNYKTLNIDDMEQENFEQKTNLLDDDEDMDQPDRQREEKEVASEKLEIFLPQDSRGQSLTNSTWEIQNLKSLKGGVIKLNESYRFKHTATESYLALDPEHLELTLKEDPLQQASSMLTIRSK